MLELQLLLFLFVANGMPIVTGWLLGRHYSHPIDGGCTLRDDYPLFGKNKTVRGLVSALFVTTLLATIFGFTWQLGLLLALFAMLGDLLSSFIKRRRGMPSGSRALGLDQIPESLLPLLVCQQLVDLTWPNVALLVLLFLLADLLLSRWLYRLHIRRRPY